MTTSERFGPYLLLKKIGRGGMAELFLARQTGVAGFERVVAIKRILPHLTEDREFVQMFVNEAKLAAQITHPNVVQIYDFGTVLGTYYIAMEYVMGKSLAAVLAQGQAMGKPIPVSAAVRITARIAAGLDHAYRGSTMSGAPLGIIHRDISPQNILIGYNGDVKLVDFGIAKAASSSTHTQTGVLKGKLAYLSPEQAWGKAVDHRSDLFALGIVLHEMLTGQRLFKAENEFTTLERVRTADVPPPSRVKSGLPGELDAIVLKALAKNPDDRYPTGQTFEEALEDYARRLSPPPSARDLSDYLRALFARDIETDTAAYQQVTTVTKTSTKTAAAPTARPASAPQSDPTRTLAKSPVAPTPPSAPVPAARRYAVIGLAVAAGVALTAVGVWSLLKPPTIEPPQTPVAAVPAAAEPAVSEPAVVPAPVEAFTPEPAPFPQTIEPAASQSRPTAESSPKANGQAPKRTKSPKAVPVTAPAKEPRRVAPPPTREARTVAPPEPPIVPAPQPAPAAPAAAAPKPVAEANPVPPPAAAQSIPRQPKPSAPAPSTAPQPTEPAHDEAPLPLLP